MTWIITRLCRDCVDTDCVTVCPVDCIYRYTGDDRTTFPNQLYINPDECIDCGACEPACPWEAIFEEDAVPGVFSDDVPLNYKVMERRPGDIVKVWADTGLANRELGWKAEKGLDEMTQSAWQWELTLAKRK